MPENGTYKPLPGQSAFLDPDPIPPGILSRGEKVEKRSSVGAAKKSHRNRRSKAMRLKRSHANVLGRNLK